VADLRRKQPTPVPPGQLQPREMNLPGLRGQIPFSVGNMILTEAEKQLLKTQFGWKEGDPVPNLSQVVQAEVGKKLSPEESAARARELEALQQQTKETAPAKYEAGTPDFKPPEVLTVENLSPEKRKEIEESIRDMRKQVEEDGKNRDKEVPFIPRDPSIAKAQLIAEAQAKEQQRKIEVMQRQAPKVELEDDRESVVQPRASVTRATAAPQESAPRALETPAVSTQSPDVDTVQAGTEVLRTHCQHCGWDLAKSDEAEITPEDKRMYTAALLGGKRFVKTYPLLDGAMSVTFRALTSKESNLILRQLFLDGKGGKVSSPAEVFRLAQEYQLAICLQSIHSGEFSIDLPAIDQHELDEDENSTGLPAVLDYVYTQAVSHESFRRVLLALYSEFDGTLAKLEVSTTKKGFWKATE
jgi:hypothetical protein